MEANKVYIGNSIALTLFIDQIIIVQSLDHVHYTGRIVKIRHIDIASAVGKSKPFRNTYTEQMRIGLLLTTDPKTNLEHLVSLSADLMRPCNRENRSDRRSKISNHEVWMLEQQPVQWRVVSGPTLTICPTKFDFAR